MSALFVPRSSQVWRLVVARMSNGSPEVVGLVFVDPIKIKRGLRCFGNVRDLGNFTLHFEGKFVGLDHPFHLMVQGSFLEQVVVQLLRKGNFRAVRFRRQTRGRPDGPTCCHLLSSASASPSMVAEEMASVGHCGGVSAPC